MDNEDNQWLPLPITVNDKEILDLEKMGFFLRDTSLRSEDYYLHGSSPNYACIPGFRWRCRPITNLR